MIVYDKLWRTMKEKGVSQYKLINVYKMSPAQITRLRKNSGVNTNTLRRFTNALFRNTSLFDAFGLIIPAVWGQESRL